MTPSVQIQEWAFSRINTGNTDGGAKLYIKSKKTMEDALAETSAQAPQRGGTMKNQLCRSRYLQEAEAVSQQVVGL